MSIKPIDLQAMFAKMNEVSKEQAIAKDQASLQQAQASRIQVLKEMEEDRRVIETPPDEDSSVIRDDESDQGKRQKKKHKRMADSKNPSSKEKPKSVIRDPDVGGHVDITG